METLVVLIDFSPMTNALLCYAETLASDRCWKLFLLHLAPPRSGIVIDGRRLTLSQRQYDRQVTIEQEQIKRFVGQLKRKGHLVKTAMISGSDLKSLAETLPMLQPERVLVAAKTRSWIDDKVMGSHWSALIAACPCPLLILPDRFQFIDEDEAQNARVRPALTNEGEAITELLQAQQEMPSPALDFETTKTQHNTYSNNFLSFFLNN
ncbi:MAG: universal stress protein [Bacteroidota bacterium]